MARNEKSSSKIFETMAVPKLFWHCVLPGSISMIASSVYIVIDGMFVGHYMGHESLAAINLMWPLLMICFSLSDMIATGSAVQISIFLGKHNRLKACRTFTFAVRLIMSLGVAAGIAGVFGTESYLRLLGANELTTALGTTYFRIYCVFAPLVTLYFAVDSYLRICGRQQFSMWNNVFVSVFNLVLDYVFIALLRCDVWAASFTTCVSLSTGTVVAMWPFLRGRMEICFTSGLIPWRQFRRMIFNGSSQFFNSVAMALLSLMINSLLLKLGGTAAVAATAAVMYIDSVVVRLLFGMNAACQPAMSYCYGALLSDRVLAVLRYLLAASASVSGFAFIVMLTAGPYLIPFYAQDGDDEFIRMGIDCMRLFALSYLGGWVEICLSCFIVALESPLRSFIVTTLRTIVFPVVSLLVLVPALRLEGIWLSPGLTGILSAAASILIARQVWKLKIGSPGTTFSSF